MLLVANTRKIDFAARVGGDEFYLLVPNAKDAPALEALCQKLLKAFEKEKFVSQESIKLGLSIGVAMFPHDGETLSDLMLNADEAMYKSKRSGKNAYTLFTTTKERNEESQE